MHSALMEAMSALNVKKKLIDDFNLEREKLREEFCLKIEEHKSSQLEESKRQIIELELSRYDLQQKSMKEAEE